MKINFCRYVWKAQTKNQDYSNCISVHSPNSPMINSKKANTSSRVDVEVVGFVNPIFSENFALKICKNKGKLQNTTFWTFFGPALEILTNLKIFLSRCFDPHPKFLQKALPPPSLLLLTRLIYEEGKSRRIHRWTISCQNSIRGKNVCNNLFISKVKLKTRHWFSSPQAFNIFRFFFDVC